MTFLQNLENGPMPKQLADTFTECQLKLSKTNLKLYYWLKRFGQLKLRVDKKVDFIPRPKTVSV